MSISSPVVISLGWSILVSRMKQSDSWSVQRTKYVLLCSQQRPVLLRWVQYVSVKHISVRLIRHFVWHERKWWKLLPKTSKSDFLCRLRTHTHIYFPLLNLGLSSPRKDYFQTFCQQNARKELLLVQLSGIPSVTSIFLPPVNSGSPEEFLCVCFVCVHAHNASSFTGFLFKWVRIPRWQVQAIYVRRTLLSQTVGRVLLKFLFTIYHLLHGLESFPPDCFGSPERLQSVTCPSICISTYLTECPRI